MELLIAIIGIGLSLILNIIAIMIFHRFTEKILSSVRRTRMMLVSMIGEQEKKTRKEIRKTKTKKGPVSPSKKPGNALPSGW